MNVAVSAQLALGFLLALVRISAWIVVTPPFNTAAFNNRVRVVLACGLALPMAGQMQVDPGMFAVPQLIGAVAYQVLVGFALGFAVMLVFTAVQVAGELIDFQAGFGAAQLYDPFTQATSTPIGRVYQLLATAILFAINGHLLLVKGLMTSLEAAPLNGLRFDSTAQFLSETVGRFLVSAIQIAAPLLIALFLAELLLGVLAKTAPQANLLSIGFIAKVLLVLLLVGITLPIFPSVVRSLVEQSVTIGPRLLGG
jgi:flagellar biosynthesis protein FliR